jgi:hypothetical protein
MYNYYNSWRVADAHVVGRKYQQWLVDLIAKKKTNNG